jgi:hypothetical protein
MSRTRQVDGIWFDRQQHNDPATLEQLERLAERLELDLDEILEVPWRQKEVLEALRDFEGTLRKPDWIRSVEPQGEATCRICNGEQECEGPMSKHHFVPRWMMKFLENYVAYSPRNICTIPICIGRHRDLHLRGDTRTEKSMVDLLTDEEKGFANKLLGELREQNSKIFELILAGDDDVYEHVLVMDFLKGRFRT